MWGKLKFVPKSARMETKMKRLSLGKKLAMLLAFVMILSALPVPVFADSSASMSGVVIFEAQPVTAGNRNSLINAIDNLSYGYELHVADTHYPGVGNDRGNLAEVIRDISGNTVIYVWPMTGGGIPANINELIRALAFCLRPGDELVFHEGTYHRLFIGGVGNHVGGTPENPIIVRGYGYPQARPVFYNNTVGNTAEITKSNMVFEFLEFEMRPGTRVMVNGLLKGTTDRFGTTLPMGYVDEPVEGVNINNISVNVVFRDNIFRNHATAGSGYALTALQPGTEYHGMRIEYNQFIDNTNAGIYIGAQNGEAPHFDITVRRNFFDFATVTQPQGGSAVGYSIQTKRGTTGLRLEENIFLGAFGPAIFFYGAMPHYDLGTTLPSYIRNNIFAGGRTDGILVAGGPVTIENNISIGNNRNISFAIGYADYRFDNVYRGMYALNNFTALGRAGNFSFPTEFPPGQGPFQGEVRGNVVGEGSETLARALDGLSALTYKPDGFHALIDAIVAHQPEDRAFTEAEVIDLLVTYLGVDVRDFGADPIVTLNPSGLGNNFVEFYPFHEDNVVRATDNGIATIDFKITPFHGAGQYALHGYYVLYGSNTSNTAVVQADPARAGRPSNAPIMLEFRRTNGNMDPFDVRMWHGNGGVTSIATWNYGEILNVRVELNTVTQYQRITINGVPSAWLPLRSVGFVDGPMMDFGAFGVRQWNNVGASHVIIGNLPWVDPPPPYTLANQAIVHSLERIVAVVLGGDYSEVRNLEPGFDMWAILTPILGWNGVVADAIRVSDLNRIEQEAALGAIRRVETSIHWANTFGGVMYGPATQQVDNVLNAFIPIFLNRIHLFGKLDQLYQMIDEAETRIEANYYPEAWAAFTVALAEATAALDNYAPELGDKLAVLAETLIVLDRETMANLAIASSMELLEELGLVDAMWAKVYEISTLVLPYYSLDSIGDYRPVEIWGYEPWAEYLFNARVAIAGGTSEEINEAMVALVNALLPSFASPVVFSWDIFNNGPLGSPSRPHAGHEAVGRIRMFTQLDGVNARVSFAAVDTITAYDQNGNCVRDLVLVNRIWEPGGFVQYFNQVNVYKNDSWQFIYLTITVYGHEVTIVLHNANFVDGECDCDECLDFGLNIFNNGPGGSPSRPNPSLEAAGTIRMWTQLAGANASVPFRYASSITAVSGGECALHFVTVPQLWVDGQGFVEYFNRIDVNKNAPWEFIELSITVFCQTLDVVLHNANYTPEYDFVLTLAPSEVALTNSNRALWNAVVVSGTATGPMTLSTTDGDVTPGLMTDTRYTIVIDNNITVVAAWTEWGDFISVSLAGGFEIVEARTIVVEVTRQGVAETLTIQLLP